MNTSEIVMCSLIYNVENAINYNNFVFAKKIHKGKKRSIKFKNNHTDSLNICAWPNISIETLGKFE